MREEVLEYELLVELKREVSQIDLREVDVLESSMLRESWELHDVPKLQAQESTRLSVAALRMRLKFARAPKVF